MKKGPLRESLGQLAAMIGESVGTILALLVLLWIIGVIR